MVPPLTDDAPSSKNSITSQIRWIRSSVRLVGKIEAGDETRRDDPFDDGKQLCIVGRVVGENPEWDFTACHILMSPGASDVSKRFLEYVPDVNTRIW